MVSFPPIRELVFVFFSVVFGKKREEFYPAGFQGSQVGMSPRRPEEWEQEVEPRLLPSWSHCCGSPDRWRKTTVRPWRCCLSAGCGILATEAHRQLSVKCYQLLGLRCSLVREILRRASSAFSGVWLFQLRVVFNTQASIGSGCWSSCAGSILGGLEDLTGRSPEQAALPQRGPALSLDWRPPDPHIQVQKQALPAASPCSVMTPSCLSRLPSALKFC